MYYLISFLKQRYYFLVCSLTLIIYTLMLISEMSWCLLSVFVHFANTLHAEYVAQSCMLTKSETRV